MSPFNRPGGHTLLDQAVCEDDRRSVPALIDLHVGAASRHWNLYGIWNQGDTRAARLLGRFPVLAHDFSLFCSNGIGHLPCSGGAPGASRRWETESNVEKGNGIASSSALCRTSRNDTEGNGIASSFVGRRIPRNDTFGPGTGARMKEMEWRCAP